MAHIKVKDGLPGIRGLMEFRPETAKPLNELVDVLLYSANSLTPGERELIATYVSYLNECQYCQTIHGAIAAEHPDVDKGLVAQIKRNFNEADISDKFKALLEIAGQVQKSGRAVTSASIEKAKNFGATELEIHDTVLIAAAFCMFNRYVDGLGTELPVDSEFYRTRAAKIARDGYSGANRELMREQTLT